MKALNRNQMAWRAAQDIADGTVVNLGIGIPTLASDHLPAGRDVFFQSENGVIGVGPAAGNGILLQPIAGAPAFLVTNTNISHNAHGGLLYFPPSGSAAASLVIDRVTATENQYGIALAAASTSSKTLAVISGSIASKNGSTGILLDGSLLKADIDLTHADENSSYGYFVATSAVVTIGRSVGANNGVYGLSGGAGAVSSYKDNRFAGNGTAPTSGTIGVATLF